MKDNQPGVAVFLIEQEWNWGKPDASSEDQGHGRIESRSLWRIPVDPDNRVPGFPSAKQMICIVRERCDLTGENPSFEAVYGITSRATDAEAASPEDLQSYARGHWGIENREHWVRDVTFDEDRSRIRVGSGPQVMATLRNLAISLHRLNGEPNIAKATRACTFNNILPFKLLGVQAPGLKRA